METNENNEPNGLNENQERHNSTIGSTDGKKSIETDTSNNDLAGVAAGNMPEEQETPDEESAIKKDNQHGEDTEQRDPKGFVGDFATPQHDD